MDSATPDLGWPLKGRITSPFGYRVHPVTGAQRKLHNGIDIAVPVGTPVAAIADGTVVAVWNDTVNGGGYSLRISHGGGLVSGYAHLSKWIARIGQRVKRGDVVALSGGAKGAPGAGVSTGPHLHLTIRRRGTPVDPMPLLPALGGTTDA